MSADLLREAAALMRERADAATPSNLQHLCNVLGSRHGTPAALAVARAYLGRNR